MSSGPLTQAVTAISPDKRVVRLGPDYLYYSVKFAGVAEIDDIAVLSKRRKGRGRQMVEMMINALPPDVVTVYAFCRGETADARAFYTALGFADCVLVPDFYHDGSRTVVLYVKRLDKREVQQ